MTRISKQGQGISGLLRVCRHYRGLSQFQLAMAAGLHPQRYWRIENGSPARPEELRAISIVLNLPALEETLQKQKAREQA